MHTQTAKRVRPSRRVEEITTKTRVACVAALLLVGWAGCADKPKPRPAPPPASGGGTAEDSTALTPEQMEEVQRTVDAGLPSVERCYEEAMEEHPKPVKVRVVVKIQVGTSQSAQQVVISESTLKSPKLEQCIKKTISGWEFPTIAAAAWFTYPFQFSPAY